MRKLKIIAALLLLALLVPALVHIRGTLPADNSALAGKKYGGWSGVLRLWVYEGWTPGAGSLAGWLNRCIARFEKAREGVYVQPRYVDAGAIASLGDSGIIPPDLILFPAGLLETPDGLAALEESPALRPDLARLGAADGEIFAHPVAMGGYVWAYDAAHLPGVPNTWENQEVVPACPADEAFHLWGAALLGLCSARFDEATEESMPSPHIGDIDLGLIPISPAPTPAATVPTSEGPLSCRLPAGFAPSASAYRDFINGDAAAIPVTQREIRRLQALSDQGKGPDWRLAFTGAVFTDQLAAVAVVDGTNADRVALSRAFAAHLLSDDCQGELHRAGAFSVTGAPSGYGGADPLAVMEDALRSGGVVAPPLFGSEWKNSAAAIVRKFLAGQGEAPALWGELAALLE